MSEDLRDQFGAEATPPPVVVVEDEQPAITESPKKRAGGPKWEVDARERVRASIRRFSKPLQDLVNRDANEGDTRLLVTDFLEHALGYDKYEELTTEYGVKGEFADYGIRIDKELVAFVEVKRVATKLTARHLRQVEMYAVNEGVEWMILTNGVEWRAYHLTGGLPVEIDLALDVELLGDMTPAQKAGQLFFLTRESLKRRQIDELWKAKRAQSPKSLADVLASDPVTDAIRRELKRRTGQKVEPAEIKRLLRETVVRPECYE
jgi:type I restriction and modification enzyme subunit R-like protein